MPLLLEPRWLVSVLALASVVALSAAAKAQDQIEVGVLSSWPPQYETTATGEPGGFAVDLMEAVAREAGVRPRYRRYEHFAELQDALREREIDVIPNLGMSEPRRGFALFTSPVETFSIVLFVRAETRDVVGIDDLVGRRLAVVRMNAGVRLMEAHPGVEAIVFDDVRTAFHDLLSGSVDGLLYPEPVLRTLATRAGLDHRIRTAGPPLLEVRRAIAVRADRPELHERLEAALSAVRASGEHARIYEAHYARGPGWWTTERIGYGALAVFVVGLIGVLLFRNLMQRRLLREATARLDAEEARGRSEDRWRRLLEAAPDAVFVVEAATGRYLDANPAASALFGVEREELLSTKVTDYSLPEETRTEPLKLEEAASGATVRTLRTLRRPDGALVPLELVTAPLEAGKVIVMARDVSERERIQAALREQEEQLRQTQKMEAVGRLAGGVAHDFNNLMTVIIAGESALRPRVPPEDRPLLDEMVTAARRAADLTQQLLAFARRQVRSPSRLDVRRVIAETEPMLRRVLPPSVALEVKGGEEPCEVRADRSQLEQVLMNLVVNARDAMPDGGRITLAVSVVSRERGGDARRYGVLEVADTGAGMDEETRAHIFEPFFTTKSDGGGTGLGLATVHGIVEQGGGFIEVESVPGDGATFRIGIPVAGPADERLAEAPSPPPEVERGAGEHVLVVDDDLLVRRVLVRLLSGAGYAVDEAASGEEALRHVAAGAPLDLLLTDVLMPGMAGPELAERLVAERPGLPVVFLSGHDQGLLEELNGGAPVRFVGKPFSAEVLLADVRDALSGSDRRAVPTRGDGAP